MNAKLHELKAEEEASSRFKLDVNPKQVTCRSWKVCAEIVHRPGLSAIMNNLTNLVGIVGHP